MLYEGFTNYSSLLCDLRLEGIYLKITIRTYGLLAVFEPPSVHMTVPRGFLGSSSQVEPQVCRPAEKLPNRTHYPI
jgi:hypothetical protein